MASVTPPPATPSTPSAMPTPAEDAATGPSAVSSAPVTPPTTTPSTPSPMATPAEDAAADPAAVTGAAPVGSVDEENEEDEEDEENGTGDGVLADGCAAADSDTTEEDTDDEASPAAAVSAPAVFATDPPAVVAGTQDAGCPPPCPPGWDTPSVVAAHVNEGATDDGPATTVVGSTRTRRRAEVGVRTVESR